MDSQKKIAKKVTGKRDDTRLHSAARAGNVEATRTIIAGCEGSAGLKELLSKQNQACETALYVAAEYGHVGLVREIIKYYDLADAGIKARNGFDAFHIAAKQGDLDVLKALLEAHPELAMTVDVSNMTALHTAATQGHIVVVNLLLEAGTGLAAIAKSNGKTALHSAARNGHLEVVRALLRAEPGIAARIDKKGQTALHMAAKGQNSEVVHELIIADRSSINMVDTKGNSALHIASRKGRAEIVKMLLGYSETDRKAVNRTGETSLDTAEKMGNPRVAAILQEHGVKSARTLSPQAPTTTARELKQTVSDIKHEVHYQLEHTRLTRKQFHGIAKQLNKMHAAGLNNAINSATVAGVLIATVAFAAIFTVPGQYADDPNNVPKGLSLGEANIAPNPAFMIFFIVDSIALFVSLAVVVVQTSVVVIESRAKKQMVAIINKLMWLACVHISVAFIALSFVVVGHERWLAIGVMIIGTTIMVATLGTLIYWVIRHRIEASNVRNIRKASMSSRSKSWSASMMSDSGILNSDYKKMYAI
ncbi:ankyrin repeat-containing protein At5g02620-like [Punica granatum]|uniref:Ankyrin repeat-containing protein At5g02620-like n=2 Tax=Punica granatum TaxID=22663 RepID=A0A6P8EAE7_PUNGR|nr:ankyrin repeat-containing protein At5g02620-like [Punica granatum]XP_031402290.1 ankyrin repeat-containing protein At5g02620-like [Punica granatum]XP_031402291.1 ankyrin repeat-containing protein At5g02620-like [Punica granatum]XP_031402292.1 ankyrin repeat-containing protein At5g02620-like [Punica granatum]OWM68844.1 hypothetical protein CDL15_Pgr025031 [Punica granatum]PKI31170.1 hypothetical protein CRG98_048416 [Punica granatum]